MGKKKQSIITHPRLHEKGYIDEFCLAILLFLTEPKLSFETSVPIGVYPHMVFLDNDWTPYSYLKLTSFPDEGPSRYDEVKVIDEEHLKKFLHDYIDRFEKDDLVAHEECYSYINNIRECTKIWQAKYKVCGASFPVSISEDEEDGCDKKLRKLETLFSLIRKDKDFVKLLDVTAYMEKQKMNTLLLKKLFLQLNFRNLRRK
ncbi:MAG: hypothetical protein LBS38_03305 [Endomicrobium sp.]|jgi:hypothetical protein|nr:hypothetical protein [Endomicrobium sp.]